MEKTVDRGFWVLLALLPVLMYVLFAIPQNITYNPETLTEVQELTPLSEISPADHLLPGVIYYTFDISNRPETSDTLFMESLHSEVWIKTNGELIYSLERGDMPWMNTTGTVFDMIHLPHDTDVLEIEVRNLYPNETSDRVGFKLGSGAEMSKDLSRSSFLPSMISALDMFIGLLMLLFWYYFRKEGWTRYSLFYLALFSVAVGAWSMSESNNFLLVIKNSAAASFTSYMSLMFFVVPFVQFTKYYYGYHLRFADGLSISAIITHLLITLLYITDIAGLKQTITLIHIHMAIGASYYIYSFIKYMRSGKQTHRKFINIIAVIILIGSSIIDFIMYFTSNMQTSFAGRFGLMIYLFILGTETISGMAEDLQEAKSNAIYKELAFMDNLTGIYNRNAYMEWQKNTEHPENITLINIDLNDLKKCNDTYGHAAGDKYIADSAQIIFDVFKNYGRCYRVGGDEFAVIINGSYTKAQIKLLLEDLEEREQKYNETSTTVQMHMAYGHANFDPEKDTSLDSVGTRADARMYAHKKLLKEMAGINIR